MGGTSPKMPWMKRKGRHRRVVEKGEGLDLMAEELAKPQRVEKTDKTLLESVFLLARTGRTTRLGSF